MLTVITLTRPLQLRIVSATTLVIILAWAALNGDTSTFGVLAYPAIIALQTAREWLWRLEFSKQGLEERPGIGPVRAMKWADIEAVLMPDAAWWRLNPVLKVARGGNVQLTAMADLDVLLELAARKRVAVEGSAASISLNKSLLPWVVLLALASLMLGAELAGATTT